jgi:UDP-glucuronate 4-epimerase
MGSVYDTNRHNEVFFYRNVDYPVSNQKANELKSRLTAIYCRRQLRFFTVYGPWGRPDITMYIFAKAERGTADSVVQLWPHAARLRVRGRPGGGERTPFDRPAAQVDSVLGSGLDPAKSAAP